MIYEHAHLTVDPERAQNFETAFRAARAHLLAASGCREVAVFRSVDRPGTYLLRVGWDRIEDHLEVFPGTPEAQAFADGVAGFFVQEPTVVHFDSAEV